MFQRRLYGVVIFVPERDKWISYICSAYLCLRESTIVPETFQKFHDNVPKTRSQNNA